MPNCPPLPKNKEIMTERNSGRSLTYCTKIVYICGNIQFMSNDSVTESRCARGKMSSLATIILGVLVVKPRIQWIYKRPTDIRYMSTANTVIVNIIARTIMKISNTSSKQDRVCILILRAAIASEDLVVWIQTLYDVSCSSSDFICIAAISWIIQ